MINDYQPKWKYYYAKVAISNKNDPIWLPQISTKLFDRIKLLFYKIFGVYHHNEKIRWFEYRGRKLIIAMTLTEYLEKIENDLKNKILKQLWDS